MNAEDLKGSMDKGSHGMTECDGYVACMREGRFFTSLSLSSILIEPYFTSESQPMLL